MEKVRQEKEAYDSDNNDASITLASSNDSFSVVERTFARQESMMTIMTSAKEFMGLQRQPSYHSIRNSVEFMVDKEKDSAHTSRRQSAFVLGDLSLSGDPTALDMEITSADVDLLQINEDLVYLALYCGYTNIRLEESSTDATLSDSLVSSNPDSKNLDDVWLTKSFFICANKFQIDAIKASAAKQHDSDIDDLGEGVPLSSASLLHVIKNERLDEVRTL